ncbi:MAG: preprotein translocase subunit SecG [Syntrophomonadaceae bacterium]|nr:preprotein translocase subunit SecG [Syntrophomonadaceae bacterium]
MLKILVLVLQIICACGLISTVLLQSGKSAGLSGSIAGGSEAIFGGKKKGLDELLSKVTAYLAVLFMLLTLILALLG